MASSAAMMRAVGIQKLGSVDVLQDVSLPLPKAGGRDLVVRIKACAVNPIDFKLRSSNLGMPFPEGETKVLGYDGAGVVAEVGPECACGFAVGDEVYFSGNCFRQGTNAECTAVDERLVAKKPTSLTFEEAAAFPLVAITGWENLVESMGVDKKPKTVLILGGAGGCGSFGIQLAKVFRCTVVATASTPESKAWCEKLGADHVIAHKVQGSHSEDHSDSRTLKEELAAIGLTRGVDGAYVCHDDRRYAAEVAEVLSPMGTVCPVVPFVPSEETLMGMYMNRQSIMFGMMFCRSIHGLECERQGQLLQRVAELIDAGQVKSIRCVGEVLRGLNAANVAKAHAMQESGHTRGKIVIACS